MHSYSIKLNIDPACSAQRNVITYVMILRPFSRDRTIQSNVKTPQIKIPALHLRQAASVSKTCSSRETIHKYSTRLVLYVLARPSQVNVLRPTFN